VILIEWKCDLLWTCGQVKFYDEIISKSNWNRCWPCSRVNNPEQRIVRNNNLRNRNFQGLVLILQTLTLSQKRNYVEGTKDSNKPLLLHLTILNPHMRSLFPNGYAPFRELSDRPNRGLHRLTLVKLHQLWLPHRQIAHDVVHKHRRHQNPKGRNNSQEKSDFCQSLKKRKIEKQRKRDSSGL